METKIQSKVYFAYNREIEYFAVVPGILAENLDGRLCREIYGEDFIQQIRKKYRELYELVNTMYLGGLEFLEFLMNFRVDGWNCEEYRSYMEELSTEQFLYQVFGYRATYEEIVEAVQDDEKLADLLDSGKTQITSIVTVKRLLRNRRDFFDQYFACMNEIRTQELESYLDAYEKMVPMLQKNLEDKFRDKSLLEITSDIVSKCLPTDWIFEENWFVPCAMLPRNAVTYFEKKQIILYSVYRMDSRKKALKILRAISDETRILIIDLLSENGHANGKTIAKWARIAPSTVSHHMDQLIECGIVRETKNGNSKEYSINYESGENLLLELEGIILKNIEHCAKNQFVGRNEKE